MYKKEKVKGKGIKRIILCSIAALLAAALLFAAGYLLYVVLSYDRIEDNQVLTVSGDATEKTPVGTTLTLMTYNVGFGAYSPDYSFFMDGGEHARAMSRDAVISNTVGALSLINREMPDFLLLQEVDVDGTRSYHVDQTVLLAEAMPGFDRVFAQNYDSPYFLYPFHQPIGANRSGLMSFSRYNMTDSLRRSLPIEESFNKYLDLDRAYSVSTVEVANGKKLMLYNVHLSAYTSDGTISDEQMRLLAADMAAAYAAGNYVIAAGDFNKDLLGNSGEYFERSEGDFSWAKPFDPSLLPAGLSLHSGTNAPTCRNADTPYRGDGTDFVLSVDGVIVSDNVAVFACETVSTGFAYSDHDPVRLEFLLKDN